MWRRPKVAPAALLTLLSAGLCCPAVYTPAPGSAERKAVLNALRPPVEKAMRQPVVFYGVVLRVSLPWAYVAAEGRDPRGRYLRRYHWDREFDPAFQALLRKEQGRWRVLSWGWGTGMDPTIDAFKKYPQAPRSLLKPDRKP